MAKISTIIGVEEIKNYQRLLPQLFAELLGTFLYISIILVADMNLENVSSGIGIGVLLASIVQVIGNVSGGHVNPAVTVGVLVMGKIKLLKALCYIAVQIVSGILGAAVSYAVTPNENLLQHELIRAYSTSSIFALELLLSFVLVAVVISVTDQNRGSKGLGSAALAIGLTLTAGICICGSVYTLSLNPVRMLSPALISLAVKAERVENSYSKFIRLRNDWSIVGVYLIAPLVGGVLAGVVYRFVLNNWKWKSFDEGSPTLPETDN